MPFSPEEFAASLKAKYPAYANIPDDELVARTLEKYPVYRSQISMSEQAPPAQAGGFAGMQGQLTNALAEGGLGFLKEAGRRVVGLGEMLRRGMTASPLGPGLGMERLPPGNVGESLGLTPSNPMQATGAQIENVAEFFLPGMGQGGALAQGAKAGGLALTQGATPGEAAVGGAIAGAGPLLGKALAPAGRGLRSLAKTQYERALAPTTQALKTEAQAVVPQLLDKRVSGGLKGLMKKAGTEKEAAGKELSAAYRAAAKAGKMSDTDAVAQSIEALKDPFYAVTVKGKKVPANPAAIEKLEELKGLVQQFGPKAPPDQLWKLRKNLDDIIQAGNGFGKELARGTANDIRKQARAAIQKELSKADPNIDSLNATYGLWKGLERITSGTLKREAGQKKTVEIGLNLLAGGGAGALLGGGAGESAGLAALVGLMRTPRWRTVSAVQKARLADLLAAGNGRSLTSYIARLGAATTPQRANQ